ncbi:heme-binding domain-containing protein [Arachidicoccus sp.]|uniref:heme-binding domain-containing protein n=1 Tax=Arachidicoccus sp. TaxID=1872624 RepID=UPI003D1CB881
MAKKILMLLVIVFIAIQFFHPVKNISSAPTPNAIALHYEVPHDVQTILKVACNDCHTNNTRYPWYNKIQPTTWYLAKHVNDGKRHLNFDEFAGYTLKKQAHKIDEVVKEIKNDGMPLTSYNLIHSDARLTVDQKNVLIKWAENLSKEIKTKNTTALAK